MRHTKPQGLRFEWDLRELGPRPVAAPVQTRPVPARPPRPAPQSGAEPLVAKHA